jgi:hypothetical protein
MYQIAALLPQLWGYYAIWENAAGYLEFLKHLTCKKKLVRSDLLGADIHNVFRRLYTE